MSRKRKNTSKITREEIIEAGRHGEFEANKSIPGRLRSLVYKNKKRYSRKRKHKHDKEE